MTSRFLSLPLAFLLFADLCQADDPKAKDFASKEGKFSVAFPGKPEESTKEADSAAGKLTFTNYTYSDGDSALLVMYCDYPADVRKQKGAEKVLDDARDGGVKSAKGKLTDEKKRTIGKDKNPGRELLIQLPDGKLYFRSRIYLVGDRLYQVIVVGPEKYATGKDADAFLDSFKLAE
jgi:hypothetical protein